MLLAPPLAGIQSQQHHLVHPRSAKIDWDMVLLCMPRRMQRCLPHRDGMIWCGQIGFAEAIGAATALSLWNGKRLCLPCATTMPAERVIRILDHPRRIRS
jgi:hypothetical protein